jgi:hypothetical protein
MRRTMFGFEGLTASGRSGAEAADETAQRERRRERERGSRRRKESMGTECGWYYLANRPIKIGP